MGRGFSFIFVFIFLFTANSMSVWAAGKDPTEMSRRGFLRGFLSGAAVVAVNPMSAITASIETLKMGLPEALKRKIVKLRLGTISQVGSEVSAHPDPFYGLKKYIELLQDLMQQTPNIEHKAIILKKVRAAEETLLAFKEVYLRGLSSSPSPAQTKAESKIDESWKSDLDKSLDGTQNIDLTQELERKPIEIRVIAIRTLLGPGLLRKMAWQVHFGNPSTAMYSEILNRSEVSLIMQYYSYLHQALTTLRLEKSELERRGLSGFGAVDSMAEVLVVQFMEEAREVILSYHKSVRPTKEIKPSSNICQFYLR
jgi:hypothetical protein